jgi:hypothetical protein
VIGSCTTLNKKEEKVEAKDEKKKSKVESTKYKPCAELRAGGDHFAIMNHGKIYPLRYSKNKLHTRLAYEINGKTIFIHFINPEDKEFHSGYTPDLFFYETSCIGVDNIIYKVYSEVWDNATQMRILPRPKKKKEFDKNKVSKEPSQLLI